MDGRHLNSTMHTLVLSLLTTAPLPARYCLDYGSKQSYREVLGRARFVSGKYLLSVLDLTGLN